MATRESKLWLKSVGIWVVSIARTLFKRLSGRCASHSNFFSLTSLSCFAIFRRLDTNALAQNVVREGTYVEGNVRVDAEADEMIFCWALSESSSEGVPTREIILSLRRRFLGERDMLLVRIKEQTLLSRRPTRRTRNAP
jgi:hypothetical protein